MTIQNSEEDKIGLNSGHGDKAGESGAIEDRYYSTVDERRSISAEQLSNLLEDINKLINGDYPQDARDVLDGLANQVITSLADLFAATDTLLAYYDRIIHMPEKLNEKTSKMRRAIRELEVVTKITAGMDAKLKETEEKVAKESGKDSKVAINIRSLMHHQDVLHFIEEVSQPILDKVDNKMPLDPEEVGKYLATTTSLQQERKEFIGTDPRLLSKEDYSTATHKRIE